MKLNLAEQTLMEAIMLALTEEAEDLRDAEDGGRPDWADVRIALAFERLVRNIEARLVDLELA